MNFSRWKIEHAHDNSADFENVAGAHEPNVHTHFIFRFKNGQGNQSFFSIHAQNTAETSQPPAQLTNDWRAIERACPRGLQRPWENFGSARLSRKRQTLWIEKKLLLSGYKFKETKHDRFGKRPVCSDRGWGDRRRRPWTPFPGRSSCFFLFFFFYDRLTTLDLCFLLWE